MRATKRLIRSVLCGIMVFGSVSFASAADSLCLVVVPARQRIVKLGFDILRMRDSVLVSYDKTSTGALVMYVWDGKQAEWVKITTEEIGAGKFAKGTPNSVIVIGENEGSVAKLAEVAAPLGNVKTITTLNLAPMMNSLHEVLGFSSGEWKYLAKTYGLELKDLNEDLRRYGHYGRPGEKQQNVPLPEGCVEGSAVKPGEVLKPGEAVETKTEVAPKAKTEGVREKPKAPEDK